MSTWLDADLLRLNREKILVFALALLFSLAAATTAVRTSMVSDEFFAISVGHAQWLTGLVGLGPSRPPLGSWLAGFFPWLLSPGFDPSALDGYKAQNSTGYGIAYLVRAGIAPEMVVFLARVPNILLGGAFVVVVASLARRLVGTTGAVIAAACVVTCPPLVGHFAVATNDAPLAFFVTLTAERAVALGQAPSRLRKVLLGLALGAALASGHGAIALLPGLAVGLVLHLIAGDPGELRARARDALAASAIVVGLALVCLSVGYQSAGGFARYAESLFEAAPASTSYLRGRFSSDGFAEYFLVALLVKLPLPFLVVSLTGIVLCARKLEPMWAFWGLLVAAISLFLLVTATAPETGVRQVLPLVPLLAVFAGAAGTWALGKRDDARIALGVLGAWSLWNVASAHPRHVAWFNEVAGGPSRGIEWLDDANVDAGQGLVELREWLASSPREPIFTAPAAAYPPWIYGVTGQWFTLERMVEALDTDKPAPGRYILSEHLWNRLKNIPGKSAERLRVRPVAARVASFRIYRVAPTAAAPEKVP